MKQPSAGKWAPVREESIREGGIKTRFADGHFHKQRERERGQVDEETAVGKVTVVGWWRGPLGLAGFGLTGDIWQCLTDSWGTRQKATLFSLLFSIVFFKSILF